MSVQSQINRISAAVSDAYDAVETMGGTLPQSTVVDNLATAILSIPTEGGTGGITQDQDGYLVVDSEAGGGSSDPVTIYSGYSGTTIVDLGKERHIVGVVLAGNGLLNYNYNYMYYSNDPNNFSSYITRIIGTGTSSNSTWRVGRVTSANITCRYLRLTAASGSNLFYCLTFDDA